MPTGYVHLFIYGSKSDMIVRCLSVRNNVFVKNNPFSGIRIFIVSKMQQASMANEAGFVGE